MRRESLRGMRALRLTVHPGTLAICRLPADAPWPAPTASVPLLAVTRTAAELSVVCGEADAPAGATVHGGWRALTLEGPFDLAGETGILASVLAPLAAAGVGIFALSTYDTDHVLVQDEALDAAVDALRAAGHEVG